MKEEKINLRQLFKENFDLKDMIREFPSMCETNWHQEDVIAICEDFATNYADQLADVYFDMIIRDVGAQGLYDFICTTELQEEMNIVSEEFGNVIGSMIANRINKNNDNFMGVH